MSEWCNSFVLVPKADGKVWICLDLVQLNNVLVRVVHRGQILNDILPRLAGIKYLTLIDANSGYHNLKLDEQSSYLTTFVLSIWLIQIHMIAIWDGACW